MRNSFYNYRKLLVLAVCGITCLGAVAYQLHDPNTWYPVRSLFLDVVSPAQRFTADIAGRCREWRESRKDIDRLIQENEKLRQRLVQVETANQGLREAGKEVLNLRQMLDFKRQSRFRLISARVISHDPVNYLQTAIIDKGFRQDVKNSSVVVSPQGLAGRVVSTGSDTSRMVFLTDSQSRVACYVSRSGCRGIVTGTGGRSGLMRYLARGDDVKTGDEILSSGEGGIFQRGIKVGNIISVSQASDGTHLLVAVAFSTDFSHLTDVFVINTLLPGRR